MAHGRAAPYNHAASRAKQGKRAGTVAAALRNDRGRCVAEGATPEHGALRGARFALAKFRPTTLPGTLVARPVLHDRLNAGAGQRLTVVVGSAGAGKSVLLSSWGAGRPTSRTSWPSCDRAPA